MLESSSMSSRLLNQIDHRPWPLPRGPWVMRMTWEHLAFLHWRVPAPLIQGLVPSGLELETWDGSAWIGIVPCLMSGVRGLPKIPPTNCFPELKLRTYVSCGGKPGVFFFSLDAASWLAVRGARLGFHLPYFDADMDVSVREDVAYRSCRTHAGAPPGNFRAIYRPTSEVWTSEAGSLEHWLTARYCLYSARSDGAIFRGEIHHVPWPLQNAEVTIREN